MASGSRYGFQVAETKYPVSGAKCQVASAWYQVGPDIPGTRYSPCQIAGHQVIRFRIISPAMHRCEESTKKYIYSHKALSEGLSS
jgi:hypothetical protein